MDRATENDRKLRDWRSKGAERVADPAGSGELNPPGALPVGSGNALHVAPAGTLAKGHGVFEPNASPVPGRLLQGEGGWGGEKGK